MLLGLGALFLSRTTEYFQAVYALLFGEILGVSDAEGAGPVFALSSISIALIVMLFRPLLLSSVSPDMGETIVFLAVVALATAMALPVVGSLLVFSLMVGPASAARALADRPLPAMLLSAGLAVVMVWAAITLSFSLGLAGRLLRRRFGRDCLRRRSCLDLDAASFTGSRKLRGRCAIAHGEPGQAMQQLKA